MVTSLAKKAEDYNFLTKVKLFDCVSEGYRYYFLATELTA